MDDLGWAMILGGVFIFLFVVIARIRWASTRKKKMDPLALLGIIILAFGLYELPWGVMEFYKFTEEYFGFTLLENEMFWTLASVSCIAIGFLIYRWRSKK